MDEAPKENSESEDKKDYPKFWDMMDED